MPNKPTDPARKILVREAELKHEQIKSVIEHAAKLEAQLLHARQEISNLTNALASINKTISIIDDTDIAHIPLKGDQQ